MIWRKWKFWGALVLAATLIGVLEAAQVHAGAGAIGRGISWGRALGSTMPSWYVLTALLPGILWLCRKFPLEPGRWPASLVLHLVAAVVFALLHVGFASWISDFVLYPGGDAPWDFRTNVLRLLTTYFVIELVTYFAVVGAYYAYDYAYRYRAHESQAAQLALKASRLEASLTRANLDSLRMQLNPHFLFNTLNAISVLAMKGERQTVVRMLTLLSDLLRLSLEQKQQLVSLREELSFLDRYLEIEQVRFKDRLTVEREIDPMALDAEVPTLLLQPLVENAVRHGISQRAGPGTVRIEAEIHEGEWLRLRVLDTGPGFGSSRTSEGTGLGVANTRARLDQLYGNDHELDMCNRAEGGACVTVRLPLRLYGGRPVDESLRSATA